MRRVVTVPIIAVLAFSTAVCVANAQQEQPRVFSVAVATVEPGHMAEYLDVVEESIIPLLEAQDVEVIGVFQNAIGGASNQVIIWVAYRDLAHLQSVAENSSLTEIQQQTFEGMRVLEIQTLTPVAFSPLR